MIASLNASERADAEIERAIIAKLQEEAAAQIPDGATQTEIISIIGKRDEARKELALRGLILLANDHCEREIREAGSEMIRRYGCEKARCGDCLFMMNFSDTKPPDGMLPGYYCGKLDLDWPRLVGRVWDIRPTWCPNFPSEIRAAMAQDPAAGNRQTTDCGPTWQRRLRVGLIALLLPILAVAALMFCRSCRGDEGSQDRTPPEVSISDQLQDREEKRLAILRVYGHAVDLAGRFCGVTKRDVGVQIPWESSARYSVVLCRDKDELVRIYKKVLEGCPPETISMIERATAFCAHTEHRIYLSRLDAEDLRHELAHMLWPDDVLRHAYQYWPKEERKKLADDEIMVGESVAESFRLWVTKQYDRDAERSYGVKVEGLKAKAEQPDVKEQGVKAEAR